jgi:Flp pilus assembly protein TadD
LGCLSQSENVSAARSLFLKASEVRRDGVEALFSLGACEIDLGMFSDAAAHLQNGIKITRFDPQSHYMLGIVYQNLGRTREAIAEFLETLKLNGRFTKALTKLAASYLKTGDVTRAMICLQEALKTEVNQAETHDLLGQIDELSGNVVHAREEYHKALEIDPNFSHSRERLEEVK